MEVPEDIRWSGVYQHEVILPNEMDWELNARPSLIHERQLDEESELEFDARQDEKARHNPGQPIKLNHA